MAGRDALPDLPPPETAPPEPVTVLRPGVVRIDRLGLELGSDGNFRFDLDEADPSSAVAEMRRTLTVARADWQVRVETTMHMSCNREFFRLRASVRAFEGDRELCHRTWDRPIPRDLG